MSRTINRIIVIGCNSVRLEANGIEVRAETGVMHIAWRDVTAAALEARDPHEMPVPAEVIEQMKQSQPQMGPADSEGLMGVLNGLELHATYDALWIVRRDDIVHVLVERSGPAREALLLGLRTRLGARWLGESLTTQQLDKRFCPMDWGRRLRAYRLIVKLLVALVVFMVVGTLVVYGLPAATLGLFGATFQALLAGEWTAALIFAGAFIVFVFLCLVAKKAIRRRGL